MISNAELLARMHNRAITEGKYILIGRLAAPPLIGLPHQITEDYVIFQTYLGPCVHIAWGSIIEFSLCRKRNRIDWITMGCIVLLLSLALLAYCSDSSAGEQFPATERVRILLESTGLSNKEAYLLLGDAIHEHMTNDCNMVEP